MFCILKNLTIYLLCPKQRIFLLLPLLSFLLFLTLVIVIYKTKGSKVEQDLEKKIKGNYKSAPISDFDADDGKNVIGSYIILIGTWECFFHHMLESKIALLLMTNTLIHSYPINVSD